MAGRTATLSATMGRPRKPMPPKVRRTLTGQIGMRMEQLAKDAGLSIDDLARRLGKDVDTIRVYFAGRSSPKVNDWRKVAKALGCSLRDLLPDE